jgi:hypothetical protein
MTPLSVRNACSEAHLTLRSVTGRFLLPFALLVAFSAVFPAWVASLSIAPAWLSGVISSAAICTAAGFTGVAVFLTRSDRMAVRDRIYA